MIRKSYKLQAALSVKTEIRTYHIDYGTWENSGVWRTYDSNVPVDGWGVPLHGYWLSKAISYYNRVKKWFE